MRVTFVLAHASLSGGTRVIAIYAQALRRLGHHVTIASTPRRPLPMRRRVKSMLCGRGWPRSTAGPSHLDGLVDVEHRVIERFRPITDADVPDADVVVATWWETGEWVWDLSPRKGAKAYFLQGFDAHRDEQVGAVERTWSLPMHKIVVAQWLADLARERFNDATVSLVPNGVDHDLFHAPPRGKQAVPTIGFMYSPIVVKGCDIAIAAIERVLEQHRVRVVCFGAHEPQASLRLPAGTEFTLQPPQRGLRAFYSDCDAWLFPGRREGFGLPILEAMACRTPVIATPTGAAPELIAEGGGVLVRADDPDHMASAIDRIVHLPQAQWRHLSDAAHQTARRRTWDRSIALFEDALRRACGDAPTRRRDLRTSGAQLTHEH